jgi:hypothetical protein
MAKPNGGRALSTGVIPKANFQHPHRGRSKRSTSKSLLRRHRNGTLDSGVDTEHAAYVSIRQRMLTYAVDSGLDTEHAGVVVETDERVTYVSIRQHTSACVSIRQTGI